MFRLLFVWFGHFECGFWQDNLRLVTSSAVCLQNRGHDSPSRFASFFESGIRDTPSLVFRMYLDKSGLWSKKKYPPLLATNYQVSTTKIFGLQLITRFLNEYFKLVKKITEKARIEPILNPKHIGTDLEDLSFTWNQGARKGKATTNLAWLLQTTPTPHLRTCHRLFWEPWLGLSFACKNLQ